jgi:hypothetical protein
LLTNVALFREQLWRNDLCRGTDEVASGNLRTSAGLGLCVRGAENAVLNMSNECLEFVPAWWRIGASLRGYFKVPTEFPPHLLTLVRKLDAIEASYLLRHSGVTADGTHDWSAS